MAKARARHILVASSEACENLKSQIEGEVISPNWQRASPIAHRVNKGVI